MDGLQNIRSNKWLEKGVNVIGDVNKKE